MRSSLHGLCVHGHNVVTYHCHGGFDKDIPSYQRRVHRITQPLFHSLKQREIELVEGPARVSWYETELLIGQPNGGSPKLSKYQRG